MATVSGKSDKTWNEPGKETKPSKKGETESRHVRKMGRLFNNESITWYILILLSLIIAILLYPNILIRPDTYRLGDVADRDIKATQEFLVEDRELTEKYRQDALKGVLSVYDFDRTSGEIEARIKDAFSAGREFLKQVKGTNPLHAGESKIDGPPPGQKENNPDAIEHRFFELLDIAPNEKIFDALMVRRFSVKAESALRKLVTQILDRGVVGNKMMLMAESNKGIILHRIQSGLETKVTDLNRFFDISEVKNFINAQGEAFADTVGTAGLALALIKPNLTFNKRETELRKDLARKSVTPFYFKVKKREMIVREGERISPQHLLKITEQQKIIKQHRPIFRVPAMAILVFSLLAAIHLMGFTKGKRSSGPVRDSLFYVLMLLMIFLIVIACNFMAREFARGLDFSYRSLVVAIPVASGAMLVSIFQGMGVAAGFSVIISVLASRVVGGQAEFFIYYFIGSLVAAHGIRGCRDRGGFIKAGLKVGICNIALAIGIEALSSDVSPLGLLISTLFAFSGGVFMAIIATGLLPLIEMSFGYTTDIKLLELANLDQPLLRELMVQAPGTYHHSVIVSNLVEACAKSVNANPLLAKVAAYYHDIGKIKKPLYFIENQMDRENKHEKLAPSMSSLILISHVKDGVEMAKKEKLGREIIDIVQQHHGTSLITYFYEKAKEQEEKKGGKGLGVKEEDFRYPGPKPQTKEAGLVMLADVVEAASKTLVDPTVARIRGMVQKIVNKVFSDGQLDECELTLKDLHEIAKSFNMTLSGIFHHRIEYPTPVAKTALQKKGNDGDTNQTPETNSRPKKTEHKAGSDESLKRLGLS